MKTLKKIPFELVEVETIPDSLEEGKFYYSEKYRTASHLCACGCGQQYPVPIRDGEWQITNNESLTVAPSLHHRIKCQAHYVITNGCANLLNMPFKKNTDGTYGFQYDTHAPGGCPM